jgi:hypothetical protein
MELFAEWANACGLSSGEATGPEAVAARKQAAEQALQEVKQLHETAPKYMFREESQAAIIETYRVEVLNLKGAYVKIPEGEQARILDSGEPLVPEEFARHYFARQGYESMFVESVPFHVLFGVYMWLLFKIPPISVRGLSALGIVWRSTPACRVARSGLIFQKISAQPVTAGIVHWQSMSIFLATCRIETNLNGSSIIGWGAARTFASISGLIVRETSRPPVGYLAFFPRR